MTSVAIPTAPGKILPNIDDLSMKIDEKGTSEPFTTWTRFGRGDHLVIFYPGAGTPVCDNHFPQWIKASEAFKAKFPGISLHHAVPDKRDVAYMWGVIHGADPRTMLPDWQQSLIKALEIGVDKSKDRHLGIVPKRSWMLISGSSEGPVIRHFAAEPDMAVVTEVTSPQGVMNALPEVIEKTKGIMDAIKGKEKNTSEEIGREEKKEEIQDSGVCTDCNHKTEKRKEMATTSVEDDRQFQRKGKTTERVNGIAPTNYSNPEIVVNWPLGSELTQSQVCFTKKVLVKAPHIS